MGIPLRKNDGAEGLPLMEAFLEDAGGDIDEIGLFRPEFCLCFLHISKV